VPIYVYQCRKCGKRFEKIESLSAPARQKCPKCGGKAERQLTAPAIQFKGSGWYVTDYSSKGKATESQARAEATATETSAKAEKAGKTETKEAPATEAKPAKEKKEAKKERKK
jgi:putative FmdB family regulatory protein